MRETLDYRSVSLHPGIEMGTGGLASHPGVCRNTKRRNKKGEDYSTTMSWILAKVSFALLRTVLLCLKGSRCTRSAPLNISDNDFEIDKELARLKD